MPSVSAIASLSLVIFLFQPSLADKNRREKRAVFDIIPKYRILFKIPKSLNVLLKHSSGHKKMRMARNEMKTNESRSRDSIEKLKQIFERWKEKNQSLRVNSADKIVSRGQANLTILFCLVLLLHL